MADFADVNGQRVFSGNMLIPSVGLWTADVKLIGSAYLPTAGGAVTFTVGDLSLIGTAYRQDVYGGVLHARITGGFGGWRNTLKRRSYYLAGGVPLSMVLGDAARELGEKIQLAQDQTMAALFARPAQSGATLLAQLATPYWWMQPSGVTYVGQRASSLITSQFTVIDYQPESSLVTVAPNSIADFAPGRTFTAPQVPNPTPISFVEFDLPNSGDVRAHCLLA